VVRSGDEPSNARSPLRLRLALAGSGVVMGVAGAVTSVVLGSVLGTVAFAAMAALASVNVVVVRGHLRQGPHFQPGADIPPYRPLPSLTPTRRRREPVPVEVRRRRYLVLMATCVTLFALAGFVVRLFSTPLAVAMCVVAAVIPPVAAIVANTGGLRGPPDDRGPDDRGP
jgi:hypothetical protein